MIRSLVIPVIILMFVSAAIAQKPSKKPTNASGSEMEVIIERDGKRTDIKSATFLSADGMAYPEGARDGKLILQYGASNDNDRSFSLMSWIATPAKGVYTIGENNGAGFTFQSSEFSNVPIFLPKSGTIEITSMPQAGGFVEGTFDVECQNVTDEGTIEKYHVSGTFKLVRR